MLTIEEIESFLFFAISSGSPTLRSKEAAETIIGLVPLSISNDNREENVLEGMGVIALRAVARFNEGKAALPIA